MSLVCPIPMYGVAAGQGWLVSIPPFPLRKTKQKDLTLTQRLKSGDTPVRLPGPYSKLKAVMPLHKAPCLWPPCGEALGRDRMGSELWACVYPSKFSFSSPRWDPDLLGVVLSAASFTNHTL